MASPPMRLHANLLFYGLDEGTWSNPPTGSNSSNCWSSTLTSTPWPDAENAQDKWDSSVEQPLGTPSTQVSMLNFDDYSHGSTDEGSEAKGSESDSLPDSSEACEGLLVSPQQQFPSATQTLTPFMSTNAAGLCGTGVAGNMVTLPPNLQVPAQTQATKEATPIYSPYLSTGSFLATHAYGGNEAAAPFGYDLGPSLNTSFMGGVNPGVMDATVVPGADAAQVAEGVPSIGSYAHLSGQCSRCCFHPKGRCANGFSCEFCHYDHEKRPRNGKKKRYRRQLDGGSDDGTIFNGAAPDE